MTEDWLECPMARLLTTRSPRSWTEGDITVALAVPRPRTYFPNRLLLVGLAAAVVIGGCYIAFFGKPLTNSQKTLTYPTSPATTGALQVTVAATGPVTNASSVPLTFKSTGKLAEV